MNNETWGMSESLGQHSFANVFTHYVESNSFSVFSIFSVYFNHYKHTI